MEHPKNKSNKKQEFNDKKNIKILKLEEEVELGLWIQVIGQIIEVKGLSGLFHLEKDTNSTGEQQILMGVYIRTIGQILEAIAVSSQIGETDIIKRLREQQLAITGDLLVSIGSAFEVSGGIQVLQEETAENASSIVP